MEDDDRYHPVPDEFTPPFSIEIRECGTWWEVDNIPDYEHALAIASSYAERLGCRSVKVTDRNCKEI